jgi:inhibitor of KinA
MVPLGDQAVLVYLADEAQAFACDQAVRNQPPPGFVDLVQAYTTVAVFYDLDQTGYAEVALWIERLLTKSPLVVSPSPGRLHSIPCCYEFALDLDRVAHHTGLSAAEIIREHSQTEYTVYALGFSPGFPYLGYLPKALCGVSRLPTPRLRVEPGSVGLAGRQTGIYPEERPGGWNLIGRTPLEIVNLADNYFPIHTGDRVRFEPIDKALFEKLKGRRLSAPATTG